MNIWGISFCIMLWTSVVALLGYCAGVEDKQQKRRCTQSKFGRRDCTSSRTAKIIK